MLDQALRYDPSETGFFQNPYRQLESLREQAGVHRTEHGIYLLLRYDAAQAYLGAPGTSVMMHSLAGASDMDEKPWQPAEQSVINQDPPNHSRLRKLVMKAFTSQAVTALRPMIVEQYNTLIAAFVANGGGDFVDDIAFPMPFNVVCNMLGVPPEGGLEVRDACLVVTKAIVDLEHSPETLADARAAYASMTDYFEVLVAEKRRRPDDHMLSALIAAEEDGARLSHAELIDMIALIYIGGFDSVISMLGSGLLLALTHPDQLARWRENPELTRSAIDEIIRFEPPVLFGGRRITTTEMEIEGVKIPAGSVVLACAASANRDPRYWGESGAIFDIERKDAARALTFGGGIHRCLGNVLARTQGEVVLGSMLQTYPKMALVDPEPMWKRGTHQRSLETLQIAIG
jgi:cytochrome P450